MKVKESILYERYSQSKECVDFSLYEDELFKDENGLFYPSKRYASKAFCLGKEKFTKRSEMIRRLKLNETYGQEILSTVPLGTMVSLFLNPSGDKTYEESSFKDTMRSKYLRGDHLKLEHFEIIPLERHMIDETLLDTLYRFQVTDKMIKQEALGGTAHKEDTFYIDYWDLEKKRDIVSYLTACIAENGAVSMVYINGEVKGFANIEGERFGSDNQYVELPFIHISYEWRGFGMGSKLFDHIVNQARDRGFDKLYMGTNPNILTQRFYRKRGCTLAKEINEEIRLRQPLDIQLEYQL